MNKFLFNINKILPILILAGCNNQPQQDTDNVPISNYKDNYVPGINDVQLAADLALNSLYPASGPLEGGTAVDLIGSGFTEKSQVYIGGKLCPQAIYRSNYRLSVTTPPGQPGPQMVKVVDGENYVLLNNGFNYFQTVKINSLDQTIVSSAGGDSLTISGQGFISGTNVKIGGISATITSFPSEEKLTVKLPELPAGPTQVKVTNINGSATHDLLIVDPTAVTSIEPPYGPLAGGTPVTISGDSLFADSTLLFDGRSLAIAAADPAGRELTFITPPTDHEGPVNLEITNRFGRFFQDQAFIYIDDANSDSRILSVRPPAGPAAGNNIVDLIGVNLPAAGAKVYFGPNLAGCETVSPQRYRCTPPPAADGLVDIQIIQEETNIILPKSYRYVDVAISGVNPPDGSIAGGQLVTVSGRGLTADTMVTFNGNAATFEQLISPQQLVVRIPAGRVGPATVTVSRYGIEDRLPDAFTYYNNANRVDWISGGRIDGTVNAFIYDSWTGIPLKDAYLLIGSDPARGFGAYSNERGMVTLSQPGLRGPLPIITASKPGYANQSYVMVDGRDMIFWLVPYPESDPPPVDQEEPPPEDQSTDSGNGDNGNTQPKVIVYPTVYGNITRQKSLEMEAGSIVWVFPTNDYVDGTPYITNNTIVKYEGAYGMTTRVGDVAIVALAGDYDEKGNFVAKNMGMSPFQSFDYDQTYQVDIVIDTPLDYPLELDFNPDAINETTPTTSTILNMDLGALGFLPWPRRQGNSAKEIYYLPKNLPHGIGDYRVHLRCGIYGPNLSVPLSEVRLGLVDHTKPVKVEPLLGVLTMESPVPGSYFAQNYNFDFTPEAIPEQAATFNEYYFVDGITGRTSWMIFSRGDIFSFTLPNYEGTSLGSPLGANYQTAISQSYYIPEMSFDDMDDYRVNDWLSRSYTYSYFTGEPPTEENPPENNNE